MKRNVKTDQAVKDLSEELSLVMIGIGGPLRNFADLNTTKAPHTPEYVKICVMREIPHGNSVHV